MKKQTINYYDATMEEKISAVREARGTLESKTISVITKKGVIDLYPEGADKVAASRDLDNAKYALLCAIGNYDGRLSEMKQYYSKNQEHFNKHWSPSSFATSHQLIETFYHNYYRG